MGGLDLMAKVNLETSEDQGGTRVYLAAKLREAKRVEEILTASGIGYDVEIEPYTKLLLGIIPREYKGAGFFVRAADAPRARTTLKAAGLKAGIQE